MKEEELEYILNTMNEGRVKSPKLVRSLSENVDFMYLWESEPGNSNQVRNWVPIRLYLIKYNTGKYTSIVLDMTEDLHVYTLSNFRKTGILSSNMEVVFKHLSGERVEQRITVKNVANSIPLIVAKQLGFQETGRNGKKIELIKDLSQYDPEELDDKDIEFSDSELVSIRLKLQSIKEQLDMLRYEFKVREESQFLIEGLFHKTKYELLECEIAVDELRLERKEIMT